MTALRPHTHRTRRAATVCPKMMPGAPSACEDTLRGSASGNGRVVLLPSVMALLGDRNWYLPRRLGWLPPISHGPAELPAPADVPRPASVAPPTSSLILKSSQYIRLKSLQDHGSSVGGAAQSP